MAISVGDIVVCTDGDFSNCPPSVVILIPNRPVTGQKYRVRAIEERSIGTAILLEELVNPVIPFDTGMGIELEYETAFAIHRFSKEEEYVETEFRERTTVIEY